MSDLREEILAALDAGFASTLKVYGRDFVEATWPHVLQEKEEKVDRIIALIRQAQADGRLPADAGRAGGMIQRVKQAIQSAKISGQRVPISDEYAEVMARAAIEAMIDAALASTGETE